MYLEGLFIIISIIIAIANFANEQKKKQNKEQGNVKGQQLQKSRPNPRHQGRLQQQPERAAMDTGNPWGVPAPTLFELSEGTEAEDRKQMGSLKFNSSEGICNEHPEHNRKKSKARNTEPQIETVRQEEAPILELTEENLIRSVVMAEVLGPPRALKRNVR